jgi:VIT1/CCC1 family predicted Fe2+/Mn2+ transporter
MPLGHAGGPALLTRLGRAVRAAGGPARQAEPQHREEHRQTNWLRDVILGGQDGLVNILGIILGVIAGGGSKTVLLAAGFAAAITESISMGAVGYTSAVSERDYYQAEQARESAEIDTTPEAERQEIHDIYAAKGFAGDLLDQVVDTITANRDSWLATMMDEELHLQYITSPSGLAPRAGRDLRRAKEAGRLSFDDPDVAIACAGGAMLGVLHLILTTQPDPSAIDGAADALAVNLLRMFGLSAGEAREVAARRLPLIR